MGRGPSNSELVRVANRVCRGWFGAGMAHGIRNDCPKVTNQHLPGGVDDSRIRLPRRGTMRISGSTVASVRPTFNMLIN